MSISNRYVFLPVLFMLAGLFLLPAPLSAQNPFLGTEDQKTVRPPAGGAPGRFVDLQLRFRDRAGELLSDLRSNPKPSLLITFLAAVFLYGVIHGAGPGHRKTVVFSLFLSRKARWYEPAAAGFLSSGVHAGTSMALILIFSLASDRVSALRGTDRAGTYMQGITFLALSGFALGFIIWKLFFHRGRHGDEKNPGKGLYPMLVVASRIPCPGATMLLLFSLSLELPLLGMLGVLFMSLGMGCVISVAGYLAYAGREGLFYRLKGRQEVVRRLSDGLEIASYVFIMALSLFMAWPFFAG